MPAPKFLAGLPKPVLFGLYGAVGGLLGALVFGEPLYQVLEPPRVAREPQVAISASPEFEVFRKCERIAWAGGEMVDGGDGVRVAVVPENVYLPNHLDDVEACGGLW